MQVGEGLSDASGLVLTPFWTERNSGVAATVESEQRLRNKMRSKVHKLGEGYERVWKEETEQGARILHYMLQKVAKTRSNGNTSSRITSRTNSPQSPHGEQVSPPPSGSRGRGTAASARSQTRPTTGQHSASGTPKGESSPAGVQEEVPPPPSGTGSGGGQAPAAVSSPPPRGAVTSGTAPCTPKSNRIPQV